LISFDERKHARTAYGLLMSGLYSLSTILNAYSVIIGRNDLIIVVDEYTSIAYAISFFKFVNEMVRT
jgi:hypothetical protein